MAHDRIRLTSEGDVLLELRHRWRDGTTHLRFQSAGAAGTAGIVDAAAMREQLGLALVPTEAEVDVVVIDAVSMPTPN